MKNHYPLSRLIMLVMMVASFGTVCAQGFWDEPDVLRHGLKGNPSKVTQFAALAAYDSPLPNVLYNEQGYVTGWSYADDNRTIVNRDEQNRIASVHMISQWGDETLTFEYGNHGKYIPVEMLFNQDYSGVMAPNTKWFPEFIKDLTAITVTGGGDMPTTITFDNGVAVMTASATHRITYPDDSNYPLYDDAADRGECNTFNINPENGRLRTKIYGTVPNDTIDAWQALVYDENSEDNHVLRSLSFGDPADYAYYIWDLTYDTDGRLMSSNSEESSRNYNIAYTMDDRGNWTTANLMYDGWNQTIEREITYYESSAATNHYDLNDLKRQNLRGDVKSCSLIADFTDESYTGAGAKNVEYDKMGYVKGFLYGKNTIDVTRDSDHRIKRISSTKDDGTNSRIDFSYGDHGKYIPTEALFYEYTTRSCTGYMAPWYPAMLRNVESIQVTMASGESHSDVLTFTDDAHTAATFTGIGNHNFTFNGDYIATDEAVYEGFNSNFYIYDIDQATGKTISRRIGYTLDEATAIKTNYFNLDLANTPDSCASKSRANTWKMRYNEQGDPVSFTCAYDQYSWTASYEYDDHGNWVKMTRLNADGTEKDVITRVLTYWSDQPDDSYWMQPDALRHGLKGKVKKVGLMLNYFDPIVSANQAIRDLEYDPDGYLTDARCDKTATAADLHITRDELHRITTITRDGQGTVNFFYGKHGKYIPTRQMLYRASWYVNVGYIPYWWPQFMRDLTEIEVLPVNESDRKEYNIVMGSDGSFAQVAGSADHYITFKDNYGVSDMGKYGEYNPNYFNYEVMPSNGKLLRTYVGIPGDTEYAEDFWYYDDDANSLFRRAGSTGTSGYDTWRYTYDDHGAPISLECNDNSYSWTAVYEFDHHDNWISCQIMKGTTVYRSHERPITYWEETAVQPISKVKPDFRFDGQTLSAQGIAESSMTLADAAGRTVLTMDSWAGQPLNLNHLPAGIYVLRAGKWGMKFVKK